MHTWTWVLVFAGIVMLAPTALADDDEDDDGDDDDAGDDGRGHDRHHDDDDDDADKHRLSTSCDIEVEDEDGVRDVEVEFESHGLTDQETRDALAACTGQANGLLTAVGAAVVGTTAIAAPLIGRLF